MPIHQPQILQQAYEALGRHVTQRLVDHYKHLKRYSHDYRKLTDEQIKLLNGLNDLLTGLESGNRVYLDETTLRRLLPLLDYYRIHLEFEKWSNRGQIRLDQQALNAQHPSVRRGEEHLPASEGHQFGPGPVYHQTDSQALPLQLIKRSSSGLKSSSGPSPSPFQAQSVQTALNERRDGSQKIDREMAFRRAIGNFKNRLEQPRITTELEQIVLEIRQIEKMLYAGLPDKDKEPLKQACLEEMNHILKGSLAAGWHNRRLQSTSYRFKTALGF